MEATGGARAAKGGGFLSNKSLRLSSTVFLFSVVLQTLVLAPVCAGARLTHRFTGVLQSPRGGGHPDILKRAHSHNDYHQESPLVSALRHGLKSVEVDVFPRDKELLVGHTIFELSADRSIKNLYIEPIVELLRQSVSAKAAATMTTAADKSIFVQTFTDCFRRRSDRRFNDSNKFASSRTKHLISLDDDSLTLLVDFKANPDKSAALLHEAIAPLRPWLSKVDSKGQFRKGKVTVIISGNRPKEASLLSPCSGQKKIDGEAEVDSDAHERFMFIDGRTHDIRARSDTTLVPLISMPWRSMHLARMVGRGERRMKAMVKEAHDQGKRLRIWGAPNAEGVWSSMMRSNVDLLSIDDHPRFAKFASRPKCL